MKKSGIAKLIAVVSAFAMFASQMVASANFALTAEVTSETGFDIINGADLGGGSMLSGFSMDSKNWSHIRKGDNYGEYHEHAFWWNNLTGKDSAGQSLNWNAYDSMNIYPVGTPETNYMAVNSPQTYFESEYVGLPGKDVTIWNGYMFIVMEKTTWVDGEQYVGGQGATFKSVIQVYDIANGKKEHVATWDAADLDFGGTDETAEIGIVELAVTDENIFMLVDLCDETWMHKNYGNNQATSYGCGLAVFDNNISRADGTYDLPTKSAMQVEFEEKEEGQESSRELYGVDTQWRLAAKGTYSDMADFRVIGDYLVYMPDTVNADMDRGTLAVANEDLVTGVHIAKWNDPDRPANKSIDFTSYTFKDWLGLTFPDEYTGIEWWGGVQNPQIANIEFDGNYAYIDIVYCIPTGELNEKNEPIHDQFDELYIYDISDPTAPKQVGKSNRIALPDNANILERRMSVADGYAYIGTTHYHHFDGAVYPYVYILDVSDQTNPVLVNQFMLRDYMNGTVTRGTEAITAIGDYLVIQADHHTVFLEMSKDRTEILDRAYQKCAMMWGYISCGTQEPLVYGSRIFYPSLGDQVEKPWVIEGVEDVDPETGLWGEATNNGVGFRWISKIEVIDFSQGLPMGIYVDDITNNDGTYTISGTIQGVEVLPNLYDTAAITVNDADGEWVGEVYYGDLITEVAAENDVSAWSFEIDEAANLTFVLNDAWGDVITDASGNPLLYENVNLELVGVDPVFTLTGTAPEAIAAGEYAVTLNASNMTATDIESAVVVVAVYDAEGKLVAVATGNPETIDSGVAKDLATVTAIVPQADSYDGYTAKALLLDSVEGLAPVCANLAF